MTHLEEQSLSSLNLGCQRSLSLWSGRLANSVKGNTHSLSRERLRVRERIRPRGLLRLLCHQTCEMSIVTVQWRFYFLPAAKPRKEWVTLTRFEKGESELSEEGAEDILVFGNFCEMCHLWAKIICPCRHSSGLEGLCPLVRLLMR